jgi:outer membrane protein TolC
MKSALAALLLALAAADDGPQEAVPAPRKGPRTLPLSAREAVSLSLNHNLDLEIARYQPWIEDQNVYSALGVWDHVAYASVSKSRDVQAGTSTLSGATRLFSDTADVTLGVRKLLPFGPSIDLNYSNSRFESNNSFLLLNPRWAQSAGATVTLPLLRGFMGVSENTTLVVARNQRSVSVDAFEKSLADSVFLVMQSYWDLVFAIENKKVKEQSLEVAQRLLDDNRRKFERGVVARIDVTQADAGVAAQQEGILTAEAAVLNAMDRLKRLIDPSLLRQEALVVPVDVPGSPAREIDEAAEVERAMGEAVVRRPEVRQIRTQMASQDATLASARNGLLPIADLSGSARLSGTDGTFRDANDELRGSDFYDLSVLLSFEIPLENSAARGSLRRAELEKRRLQLQERNLENQILVEIREAVRAIKTNEKRVEATRRARVLAQEQLDGELTRREQGLSTTFRVLDVQEDLVLARTNEAKALIDYNLSWHKLHQATGSLLERSGILLRENLQPRVSVALR